VAVTSIIQVSSAFSNLGAKKHAKSRKTKKSSKCNKTVAVDEIAISMGQIGLGNNSQLEGGSCLTKKQMGKSKHVGGNKKETFKTDSSKVTRPVSKTMKSTFKLGYSEEEAKAAPAFDRKLTCKVNIETKHEPQNVIGISKFGYVKDASYHKRGRSSHNSNNRTFGSQVRYLPGSITDEIDIVIPVPTIKIGEFIQINISEHEYSNKSEANT